MSPQRKPIDQATDEHLAAVGEELRARMAEMGLTAPMLARRVGANRAAYLTPLLNGRRSPIGDGMLRKVADVLAIRPAVLIARVRGMSDEPLTSMIDPRPEVDPTVEEGPAARVAELVKRLDHADAVLIERFVLRLLGK